MRKENVAAYVRVSTQEQKLHGYSVAAQHQRLEEYAEKHNLNITNFYVDDGISGRKAIKKRPALMSMAADAASGKFERIIFIKLDRFFRSVSEYYEFMKLTHDIPWTATDEPIYDTTTATGRMNVNIKLSIAQLEAEQTSERIKMVNDYKVQNGQVITGTVPWCFKIEERDGKKVIVKNPETQHIMEDLIEFYLAHQSKRKTVIYLNNKYGLNFQDPQVVAVLRNEKICGSYRGNPNYCEAYIDRETFDLIQDIDKNRHIKNNTIEPYFFSGLLRCPVCGCRLGGFRAAYSSRDYKKSKRKYKKYRCGKYYKTRLCSYSHNISENLLERTLLEMIEGELENVYLEYTSFSDYSAKSEVDRKKSEIESEIGRLNYSWQKGRIKDPAEYDKKYDALTAKLKELDTVTEEAPDFERIRGILSGDWKETYQELDPEHKQMFWRSFIKEIQPTVWTLKERKLVITFF